MNRDVFRRFPRTSEVPKSVVSADADDDDVGDDDAYPKKSVAGLIDEKFRKFGDIEFC